jgi:hypothetical protein
MAYFDVAMLHADPDFLTRVTACYAGETLGTAGEEPNAWTVEHAWDVASAPGFGDAYASAVASGVENPGRDQAVVSDAQILSAVQFIIDNELGRK